MIDGANHLNRWVPASGRALVRSAHINDVDGAISLGGDSRSVRCGDLEECLHRQNRGHAKREALICGFAKGEGWVMVRVETAGEDHLDVAEFVEDHVLILAFADDYGFGEG